MHVGAENRTLHDAFGAVAPPVADAVPDPAEQLRVGAEWFPPRWFLESAERIQVRPSRTGSVTSSPMLRVSCGSGGEVEQVKSPSTVRLPTSRTSGRGPGWRQIASTGRPGGGPLEARVAGQMPGRQALCVVFGAAEGGARRGIGHLVVRCDVDDLGVDAAHPPR